MAPATKEDTSQTAGSAPLESVIAEDDQNSCTENDAEKRKTAWVCVAGSFLFLMSSFGKSSLRQEKRKLSSEWPYC